MLCQTLIIKKLFSEMQKQKNIQSLPEPRPTFPQEKGEDIPHTMTY